MALRSDAPWFKCVQGVPTDLHRLAEIIMQQPIGSLHWASQRVYEFVRMLGELGLVPDRLTNDVMKTMMASTKDFAYFDHVYGVNPRDPYGIFPVWMMVSLQMMTDPLDSPLCEVRFCLEGGLVDLEGYGNPVPDCEGSMSLKGIFGRKWHISGCIRVHSSAAERRMRHTFSRCIELRAQSNRHDSHKEFRFAGDLSPRATRELIRCMARYLKRRGKR